MKRKILSLLIVLGGFALVGCQEDAAMDELIQDTELNTTLDPDDDDPDKNPPPPSGS